MIEPVNVLAVPPYMRPTWCFVRALGYWWAGDEARAHTVVAEGVAELPRLTATIRRLLQPGAPRGRWPE